MPRRRGACGRRRASGSSSRRPTSQLARAALADAQPRGERSRAAACGSPRWSVPRKSAAVRAWRGCEPGWPRPCARKEGAPNVLDGSQAGLVAPRHDGLRATSGRRLVADLLDGPGRTRRAPGRLGRRLLLFDYPLTGTYRVLGRCVRRPLGRVGRHSQRPGDRAIHRRRKCPGLPDRRSIRRSTSPGG